jgi:hypothetical protein
VNPFEMVVMIVALGVGARVLTIWLGNRPAAGDPAKDSIISDLSQKVQRLEQRVQTLEKLATDPAHRLSDEIERLRS